MRKNTIFAQLVQLLSKKEFKKIVDSHDGDKYTKTMNCWQQLMILLYAQIKDLCSLRDIETAIKSRKDDWEDIGVTSAARTTLADANAGRSCAIFEEMFYRFLSKCREIAPKHQFRVSMPVYSHDSTLIPLCLSVYPWARYRKRKGAMKLHMLLDHDGYLPSFIDMSEGRCHDVNVMKKPEFNFPALPPDSILTMDRGYIDYTWLYSLEQTGVLFIIREKSNMAYLLIPTLFRHIVPTIFFSNGWVCGLVEFWRARRPGHQLIPEAVAAILCCRGFATYSMPFGFSVAPLPHQAR